MTIQIFKILRKSWPKLLKMNNPFLIFFGLFVYTGGKKQYYQK
jgi:hypothetical protein